jgi:hypothetical protein
MVTEYLGKPIQQCAQASNQLHRDDCCSKPTPDDCDLGGWPELDHYGFSFKRTHGAALSWEEVKAQLGCNLTPFLFSWRWVGGGGHMMVAAGYYTDLNGQNFIEVIDPQQRVLILTYDSYVMKDGLYTHWDDFYDIKAK